MRRKVKIPVRYVFISIFGLKCELLQRTLSIRGGRGNQLMLEGYSIAECLSVHVNADDPDILQRAGGDGKKENDKI